MDGARPEQRENTERRDTHVSCASPDEAEDWGGGPATLRKVLAGVSERENRVWQFRFSVRPQVARVKLWR